jgi:hypothetical protein
MKLRKKQGMGNEISNNNNHRNHHHHQCMFDSKWVLPDGSGISIRHNTQIHVSHKISHRVQTRHSTKNYTKLHEATQSEWFRDNEGVAPRDNFRDYFFM